MEDSIIASFMVNQLQMFYFYYRWMQINCNLDTAMAFGAGRTDRDNTPYGEGAHKYVTKMK